MSLLLIDKHNLSEQNINLLRAFEREIYIDAFPDVNERESFDDIIPRISGESGAEPSSFCVLSISDDGTVNGGLVTDWYDSCGALEIIYIATAKECRKSGVGSSLRYDGLKLINEAIGSSLKHIFLEVDIPSSTDSSASFSPTSRLAVWDKWGARRIPISYIQPPLSPGKDYVDGMMLMMLPLSADFEEDGNISSEELKSFLRAFYRGLDASDSETLKSMEMKIDSVSKEGGIQLERILESPSYELFNFAVTEHFRCDKFKDFPCYQEDCLVFNSYECDLMNFSNQQLRPFKTHFVKVFRNATLYMPDFYSYTSEGLAHYRLQYQHTLKVNLSISITATRNSDFKIAHLTIASADNESINELDMIKLIAPFGSRQENYRSSGPIKVSLSGKEAEAVSFERLLADTIGGGSYSVLSEGLSRIDISAVSPLYPDDTISVQEFFEDYSEEKDRLNTHWNRVLCGLILGIFDFERMDSPEITDTIRPIVKVEESFMVLCRGHLMKIETMTAEEKKALSPILISAYTLIPSTALAFNELYLSIATSNVRYAFHHKAAIKSGHRIQEANKLLSRNYLKDIFQYPSEKEIIATGIDQRSMKERYDTLKEQISIFKSQESRASDIILECLLGVVALFQIMSVFASKLDWSAAFIIILISLVIIEFVRWIKVKKD